MKYFCGYVPDASLIKYTLPVGDDHVPYFPWGNSPHAHPMKKVGVCTETGEDIFEQKDEQAMGIIACDEVPPCFSAPGVVYWEMPEGLASAKAKAIEVGIKWEDIPQIAGKVFL